MDILKGKINDFSRIYYKGSIEKPFDGNFSSIPVSSDSDLFGAIDFVYSFYICGILEEVTSKKSRNVWADRIMAYQGEEGWFNSSDFQKHSVYHSTAYALGALKILGFTDGKDYFSRLSLFSGLMKANTNIGYDRTHFNLNLIEKLHFWRGSHKAGGIAAIVGQISEVPGLTEKLLGITAPRNWLEFWAKHYFDKLDSRTGLWLLVPYPIDLAFGLIYRLKHSPGIGKIGGAAHLYWIFTKMGLRYPSPEQLSMYTLNQNLNGGLYEKYPYCLDFDGNFLLGRSYSFLDKKEKEIRKRILVSLEKNKNAVIDYLINRKPDDWYLSSHPLPGALAAVAEADLIIEDRDNRTWKDVFELVWWL
jgi:hypothetical protein